VELLCDRVSIIRAGRIVESGTLSELRHLTRTEVSFEATDAAALDGITAAHDGTFGEGRVKFTVDSDAVASVLPELARRNVTGLRIEPPSLEELFLRHYGDDLAALEAAGSGASASAKER
jgi:ABC-2 type transport system ATP-binding protein